ncbi:MAG: ABC transporter permease [Bacteroidetes bacterium]|nr:MAG: ABC transporter permease [Bacteroidota bacterium]
MHKQNSNQFFLSKKVSVILVAVYEAFKFTISFFKEAFTKPFHMKEIIKHGYEIGLKSLGLITLTGFIVGVVFTKQSRPSLESFGATSWLPSLMGIATIRALGPLVTALICAGKVGSGIGAELGSMRVTEQIDAMEVSSINPFKYLVVPRVWGASISIFILSLYYSFVGLLGAYINIDTNEGINMISFLQSAFEDIGFLDIFTSLIKSAVYGLTIGLVGTYKGYNASKGTRGVGIAANQAVVTAIFFIFIEELFIVQIANLFR